MTLYAFVRNHEIIRLGTLPYLWVDDQGEIHLWGTPPYKTNPADYGWLPVVKTEKPEDLLDGTYASEVQLIEDVPTVVWVFKPREAKDIQARTRTETLVRLKSNIIAEDGRLQNSLDVLDSLLGDKNAPGSLREWRTAISTQMVYDRQAFIALANLLLEHIQQTRVIAKQTARLAHLVLESIDGLHKD